jgi:hypothetical protein
MITRQRKNPEDFWREYEEKTGEKVLSRSLGQYVSGWEEFDLSVKIPIWGLIIATSGGFRFHHFPQTNWLSAITNIGLGDNPPEEKTIFIPHDKIVSAVLHRGEVKWYKRIFFPDIPRLLIRYRGDEAGTEKELLLYAEHNSSGIAEALYPQK